MARPSKLTPEIEKRICDLIKAGNTVEIAAQAGGISDATFYAWMGRTSQPYEAFQAAVETARAESEAVLVTRIAKAAANGSWMASAWLLERRFSERWDKKRATTDPIPAPVASIEDELAKRRAVH